MSEIAHTKLPSGLRIITDYVPSVDTVVLGAWVGVGTRHEDSHVNGIAHMVEHMMFKGTPTRRAQDIAEQIENVGGHINAYTSREVTSYHAHLLKQDAALGLDILADILQHPMMPEEEIARERHVILQEIGMANDTPDDLIFDEYQETVYPGQALGAPILGRPENVRAMRRDDLMDYVRRLYTAERIVISAAGNIRHEDLVQKAEVLFSELPAGKARDKVPARYAGGMHRIDKALEQAHVILGFEGVSRLAKDYYAAQLLSTLLGGGISSRLFQEVRERRGLVYSIYSFLSSYSDSGNFGIYAGTGPEDLSEMIPVLCEEIGKISKALEEEEIARGKAQLRARLLMGLESMMNRADRQAKMLLLQDKLFSAEEVLEKIEAVTAQDIAKVADKIFSSTPALVGLGPLQKLEPYEKIQGRLAA